MPLPRTRLQSLNRIEVLASRLGHQPVGDAFRHRRLSGPDIAVKDHQRILLGDEIAYGELAAMVLAVPLARCADIQQQAKLVMNTGVTCIETK